MCSCFPHCLTACKFLYAGQTGELPSQPRGQNEGEPVRLMHALFIEKYTVTIQHLMAAVRTHLKDGQKHRTSLAAFGCSTTSPPCCDMYEWLFERNHIIRNFVFFLWFCRRTRTAYTDCCLNLWKCVKDSKNKKNTARLHKDFRSEVLTIWILLLRAILV